MNRVRTAAAKSVEKPKSAGSIIEAVTEALISGAVRGEVADLDRSERSEIARFLVEAAKDRGPETPVIHLESVGGAIGQRRMRLAAINDDMPFLVDSVSAAVAAQGLVVHRLLHPVVAVRRTAAGKLTGISNKVEDGMQAESFLYLEIDRAPATQRQILCQHLADVLNDVRASVEDWQAMQTRLRKDAEALGNEEAAALLDWFADGAMTLLGYHVERPGAKPTGALGLLRRTGEPVWDENSCSAAVDYFREGGPAPLIAKADRRSTVHRRVPFDLVVLPERDGDTIKGIHVHAGLWTSQALGVPAEQVPVLRQRLAALEESFGFDPRGHAGKALRHAATSLPRDLLVSLRPPAVRRLVTTAMSLADRPRATIELVSSVLKGHLFAFVWLPRDELATERRIAIGELLEAETKGIISSWSLELGEGDLAMIRYTIDVDPRKKAPDSAKLDRQLNEMLRGWQPGVEEALVSRVGPVRATRLCISLVSNFPESYRERTATSEAADDVVRIAALQDPDNRGARLLPRPGGSANQLRLKTYRLGGTIALSEAVPVFENFGFRVLEEQPTALEDGLGHIHEFLLETPVDAETVLGRADVIEQAIAAVLEGRAENDAFNQLMVAAALPPEAIILFRAWFRYLRQIGLAYGLGTTVEALRKAPVVAHSLNDLFCALHDPARRGKRETAAEAASTAISEGLVAVAAIDEDRILRMFRFVILATLRTNAFTPAAEEALAFKIDSSLVPNVPAPVPWREIWVYSPRVEGVHLRAGPVARGGIRWSDRRDDFRTEILGLMKAQVVKNAVIIPTGAKGGFYPKHLPAPAQREAWLAEGTEAYRIFIRSLLSVTDNIVGDEVVHPESMVIRDGDDPYFVVAADKGTASFSDIANDIALSRSFWLGDAFASGGSNGYDHKEMGITARGAWISVQRHFAEAGIDVQTQPVRAAGCGDMSGDVFGNGMLQSKAIKLVAAFDHRHLFIDPDPDPAKSWAERKRLFELPRSSWDDYDKKLISKGGGVFPRSQKSIRLTPEMKKTLGLDLDESDPTALINALLKAPVDLIFFGGIGTFVKSSHQNHADVGDPGNDGLRVNGNQIRAQVIGEGANLAVTQAGRIEFAQAGGRINTDFIDNSAGVDCSDNEVNIKIPLNREMAEGRLTEKQRNTLLAEMTDDVAQLVLENNRLQTLALSIAELGGPGAVPAQVRAIEILEESGRLNRAVEGLDSNEALLRRVGDHRGLTRPELSVLLSTSKLALQDAIETSPLADDPALEIDLMNDFPKRMQKHHGDAIRKHRLRREIISTRLANRFVNRLGILAPFALAEEEGASWAQAAAGFAAAERLFNATQLWREIDQLEVAEDVRLRLFHQVGNALQFHIGDIIRSVDPDLTSGEITDLLAPGLAKLEASVDQLLRTETRAQADAMTERLRSQGVLENVASHIVHLFKMNGAIGIAALGRKHQLDEIALTHSYTRLGEALGLDWAQSAISRIVPVDQWERLLTASLARDFEQLRLGFLDRRADADPEASVEQWLKAQDARIAQFRGLVDRARTAAAPSLSMLAQIAAQTRVLLAR
jgi:glutamate dehydrogenase